MPPYPYSLLDIDEVLEIQASAFGYALAGALVILLLARWRRWSWDWLARRARPALEVASATTGRVVAIVVAIALGGSAATGLATHMPSPSIHDEFGYLLIADTILQGRLANPTPPAWEALETRHILMQPTYQAKFPPGAGVLLALGMGISGGSIAFGAWLKAALACGALAWMLAGFVERRWALAGGVLAAATFAFGNPWAQSFWGGAAAMLGGALAYGAVGRLHRDGLGPGNSVVLSLGLLLVAFTRPLEGAIAMLPLGAWIMAKLVLAWRQGEKRDAGRLLVLQAAGVAAILGCWGIYNHAVTGSALRMPYIEYNRQYAATPDVQLGTFKEPLREPYRFAAANKHEREAFKRDTRGESSGSRKALLFFAALLFLVAPPLVPAALHGLWRMARGDWTWRALLASGALGVAAAAMSWGSWPHYYAPVAGVGVLAGVLGLQALWRLRGRWTAPGRALALACCAGALAAAYAPFDEDALAERQTWGQDGTFGDIRGARLAEVLSVPGDHIVFVHYPRNEFVHVDWVFNEADVPGARVVWATMLDGEQNAATLAAYPGRSAWVYNADDWAWEARADEDEPAVALALLERGLRPADPADATEGEATAGGD